MQEEDAAYREKQNENILSTETLLYNVQTPRNAFRF